jgi:hypothetical protein
MPTIRSVPSPYATIAEAHAAAVDGDTILLAPGDHAQFLAGTKRVHIKGNTTDPINNPCRILCGTSFEAYSLKWTHPPNAVGDWWIEGVTLQQRGSNVNCSIIINGGNWPVELTARLNRCVFDQTLSTFVMAGWDGAVPVSLRITQCTLTCPTISPLTAYIPALAGNKVLIAGCKLKVAPPTFYTNIGTSPTSQWALYTIDVVTSDTAGYGAGYGEWYSNQWQRSGTVRYVHPTLGPYTTPQAAHDAATAGDTLVISAGTYGFLNMTKPVNVVGEQQPSGACPTTTLDDTTTFNYGALIINIPTNGWGAVTSIYIEGLVLAARRDSSYSPYWHALVVGAVPTGKIIVVSRCRLLGNYGLSFFPGQRSETEFRNCSFENLFAPIEWIALSGTSGIPATGTVVRLFLCYRDKDWDAAVQAGLTTFYNDSVKVATPNYGCAYGSWLAGAWQPGSYSIPCKVRVRTGDSPSGTKFRLYKESAGLMEVTPWAIANADSVTGEAVFNWLPTTERYWVQMIPPPGYRPTLDGPYIPVAT